MVIMARSGMLNRRIELWRKVVTKNEYGEYQEDWLFHKYIRAYVFRNTGAQIVDNEEVFDIIRLRLQVRNQSDIIEMDRLKVYDRLYQVDFIQPDDTRRWLNIHCTRINE